MVASRIGGLVVLILDKVGFSDGVPMIVVKESLHLRELTPKQGQKVVEKHFSVGDGRPS